MATDFTTKKLRKMTQINLDAGDRIAIDSKVPVSLRTYIKTINRLNENSDVYRTVYIPLDQDYNDFIDSEGDN